MKFSLDHAENQFKLLKQRLHELAKPPVAKPVAPLNLKLLSDNAPSAQLQQTERKNRRTQSTTLELAPRGTNQLLEEKEQVLEDINNLLREKRKVLEEI